MNVTGDSQRDDGQSDVLAIEDPQVDICISMSQGDSRSPAVYVHLTGKAPLVLEDRQDRSSSGEVDLYLVATNLHIARRPFRNLEAAVESGVGKFETEMVSDCPRCFELAVTANVLVDAFEAFSAGDGDMSMIDQNIV